MLHHHYLGDDQASIFFIVVNLVTDTPNTKPQLRAVESIANEVAYWYMFLVSLRSRQASIPNVCVILTHLDQCGRFDQDQLIRDVETATRRLVLPIDSSTNSSSADNLFESLWCVDARSNIDVIVDWLCQQHPKLTSACATSPRLCVEMGQTLHRLRRAGTVVCVQSNVILVMWLIYRDCCPGYENR